MFPVPSLQSNRVSLYLPRMKYEWNVIQTDLESFIQECISYQSKWKSGDEWRKLEQIKLYTQNILHYVQDLSCYPLTPAFKDPETCEQAAFHFFEKNVGYESFLRELQDELTGKYATYTLYELRELYGKVVQLYGKVVRVNEELQRWHQEREEPQGRKRRG